MAGPHEPKLEARVYYNGKEYTFRLYEKISLGEKCLWAWCEEISSRMLLEYDEIPNGRRFRKDAEAVVGAYFLGFRDGLQESEDRKRAIRAKLRGLIDLCKDES